VNASTPNDWMPVLSRLNSILLGSDEWKGYLTERALSTAWCGQPPAPESEILKTEGRLGLSLPPSYRSFLLISNGWHPFNSFIERLLPVQEVERFRIAEPEDSALIQELYQEENVPDSIYLDYETPEHMVAVRARYYPDSLLAGRKWDGGGGELLLLNPQIVSGDGEWETIFFGNWLPGNRRYRSFFDFIRETVSR
jgi:SMI1 / KNR4 family (SUKH-1)